MRLKVYAVPAALLVLFCAACNGRHDFAKEAPVASSAGNANSTVMATAANEDEQPLYKNDQSGGRVADQKPGKTPPPEPKPNPDWDRKIIKTADLSIEVKNFQLFSGRLHAEVRQSGGYIAQEQQNQSSSEIENTVSIKVPVDRFEDLMGQFPADSDKLVQKKVSSQDVTTELVDTKSRLETKKEVRERYLDLLKQSHSMKDIITVQNEINDIQEQMDQAAGRIAWLGHSSSYSTINLHFYQLLEGAVVDEPSPTFMHKVAESMGEGWKGFSVLLLDLLSVWPLWIVVAAGIFRYRKWHRGMRARMATAGNPGQPAAGHQPLQS